MRHQRTILFISIKSLCFCDLVCLQVNEEVSAEPTADSEVKEETEAELREVCHINSSVTPYNHLDYTLENRTSFKLNLESVFCYWTHCKGHSDI